MSHLRTYRVLQLLVVAALLFGPTAPLIRAACAMNMSESEVADMPCDSRSMQGHVMTPVTEGHTMVPGTEGHAMMHGKESHEMVHQPSADLDATRCEATEEAIHICCRPGDVTPAPALLTTSNLRVAAAVAAAVLPGVASLHDAPASVHPESSSGPPSFHSPIRRQALLATFLI